MKYVISSAKFTSKKKALEQIREWTERGSLDKEARVYGVKKTFKPVRKTQLEEVK